MSSAIFGDDSYINEDGRILFLSRGYARDLGSAMLYAGWTPLHDACFWRRDLYERVGGIDPTLRYAADYDLFLHMARNGKAAYREEREHVRRREARQGVQFRGHARGATGLE